MGNVIQYLKDIEQVKNMLTDKTCDKKKRFMLYVARRGSGVAVVAYFKGINL